MIIKILFILRINKTKLNILKAILHYITDLAMFRGSNMKSITFIQTETAQIHLKQNFGNIQ